MQGLSCFPVPVVQLLQEHGIDGLFDERPTEKWTSSLPPAFLKYLEDEKNADKWASIPEIIRRAEKLRIIDEPIDRTTAWHAARKMNLPMFRKRKAEETAMRPFAYAHRLQMVLCDGKHFRAGPGRAKRVCFFFLDDATRYALYAIVGFSESSELFLRGFFELICRHGLISALYLDKGPGFIAKDAARVCACLNIPIIHGRTRYPQGHGKIERFNDTAFQRALRSLARPDIDPSPQALTLRINHFIGKEYNRTFHEGIKATPQERFDGDSRPLTYPLSEDDLRRHFVLDAKRKVRPDNVVKINDVLYEVPLGYSGRRIMVYRDLVEVRISMFHEGRLITLKPADLAANARERRGVKRNKEEKGENPIRTAADISFDEDFSPITDPYGGFQQPED